MINLRMIALASALLVVFAAYATSQSNDPPEDVVEYGAHVAAWVEDIVIADPQPEPVYGEWELGSEQLVEGHTVFHVIERSPINYTMPGTFNVTAFLNCRAVANGQYGYVLGFIKVPTKVDEAGVECENGARVVISPSLLYQPSSSPLMPTGHTIPFTAPSGEEGELVEYVFTAHEPGPDGVAVARDHYAWSAPVLTEWVHEDDRPKNLWMPLPLDRLAEMGVTDFTVTPETRL